MDDSIGSFFLGGREEIVIVVVLVGVIEKEYGGYKGCVKDL